MSSIYIFIIAVILILAIADIIVGVSNDAVNFLNSAFGSKVASRRVILITASVGIMIGILTSEGMMEVARSGVFYPSKFTFKEIMLIFLGVMLADVILLNIFNSLGLPTSTTVSLIFELLGASVGVALYHIKTNPDMSMNDMSQFINSGNALVIISAILLSVIVALVGGVILMYISRLIFSFRYKKSFAKFGAVWSGITIVGIIYFAVFKGLKGSGMISKEFTNMVSNNIFIILLGVWLFCSIVFYILQKINVNILKITILAGTLALALAFAGNDLVNFIGVPMAGLDSYQIVRQSGDINMTMESLMQPTKVNFPILIASGLIMVLTLFLSKKAMNVTQTELKLSSQNDNEERFGSTLLSRHIVRFAVNTNKWYKKIFPQCIITKINKRFDPLTDEEKCAKHFDLIRATVNLMAASILISMATSLKLPLSTTYVTFMVAMGSSLADRAWGRESAVYRVTGVMTVISGWFITAMGGFLIALLFATIIAWGGNIAIILVCAVCGYLAVKKIMKNKNSKANKYAETVESSKPMVYENEKHEKSLLIYNEEVSQSLDKVTKIYNRTMVAVFKENRKVLKEMVNESGTLYQEFKARKYEILPTLKNLQSYDVETWHFYVQVTDYLSEVTKSLLHITRPCFNHIDNNHEGLSKDQITDLMKINDEVEKIYSKTHDILSSKNFDELEAILEMRDSLFEEMAKAIKDELERVNKDETKPKASALYLTILSETKTMVLQYRNLLKSEKYFLMTGK